MRDEDTVTLEIIASMGEARTGTEHTEDHDAQWQRATGATVVCPDCGRLIQLERTA